MVKKVFTASRYAVYIKAIQNVIPLNTSLLFSSSVSFLVTLQKLNVSKL